MASRRNSGGNGRKDRQFPAVAAAAAGQSPRATDRGRRPPVVSFRMPSRIAELAPDGTSVLFSELLSNGAAGQDLVLNPDGSLTVAGPAKAAGLNVPNGFVLRLPRGTPTGVSILGMADSAVNAVTGRVAPGEY